ncbi:MAG: hypothetical protein ACRBFS_03980 [Aureispira sp.]
MEHLYIAHLLLVFLLLFFPKKIQQALFSWQQVILIALLWLDLLNHFYGLMSNQIYFQALCSFYERTFLIEGMFWWFFLYHHIAAFVGLLLTIDYLRQSRLFIFFWVTLAAYPLLLNWLESQRQLDLEGQVFYELSELSTINRDITSLIIEFNGLLTLSYLGFLLLFLLFAYAWIQKKKATVLNNS